jgi:hypothetical protein
MKTKIEFECRELNIVDGEFGFTIIFSENLSADDQYKSEEELMNSNDHHLLIQLSYPEDEFESEYYYVETRDLNFELTKETKLKLQIERDVIQIENTKMICRIKIYLTDKRKRELLQAMEMKFDNRIEIAM